MLTIPQAVCLSKIPATGPELRDLLISHELITPGNHYAFLDRLVTNGLIKRKVVTNGVRINHYSLTPQGEKELAHAVKLCKLILS